MRIEQERGLNRWNRKVSMRTVRGKPLVVGEQCTPDDVVEICMYVALVGIFRQSDPLVDDSPNVPIL